MEGDYILLSIKDKYFNIGFAKTKKTTDQRPAHFNVFSRWPLILDIAITIFSDIINENKKM